MKLNLLKGSVCGLVFAILFLGSPTTSNAQLFGKKKSEDKGKTLSSTKGKEKKKGGGIFSFKKLGKEGPGIEYGEIVATERKGWSQPTPYGMVLVPSGSYMMGQADEDITHSAVNFNKRVTVSAFFMDDTEITNHEYRQFTNTLFKDSLQVLGEEKILSEYYPDTTVWKKDFTYHNGDPMLEYYFSSPAYDMYPVVGVSWTAAKYFCLWRSNMLNDYRKKQGMFMLPRFELPSESEWEWAARGGKIGAKYPWGGPYLTMCVGCELANFKPHRGNYDSDGYSYTAPANSYNPNEFGLYNMSGNVAEWCIDAYSDNVVAVSWDLNTVNNDPENPKKVIRGGSWKDVGYYLETGTRAYELENQKRSYIGFRCMMRYLGRPKN
ncbi:gliding motility protein [Sandaracinomonas limnophila]|uniref:Gliding motility protein n=1 Tax=Sandaracinomonas limnophila TaxID=1862386 RepID=A0A437PNA4_9BACT|nr:SUMF1/EgtB/PvdO family nonheme iron enzyme [Sandaracinomonas limnophila]RVU23534.1 gliding motility protein [Sandaracinomonas limnophila]